MRSYLFINLRIFTYKFIFIDYTENLTSNVSFHLIPWLQILYYFYIK